MVTNSKAHNQCVSSMRNSNSALPHSALQYVLLLSEWINHSERLPWPVEEQCYNDVTADIKTWLTAWTSSWPLWLPALKMWTVKVGLKTFETDWILHKESSALRSTKAAGSAERFSGWHRVSAILFYVACTWPPLPYAQVLFGSRLFLVEPFTTLLMADTQSSPLWWKKETRQVKVCHVESVLRFDGESV